MTADAIPEFPFDRPTALEPPPQLADLRDTCPVAHVRLPSGDVAALVTRYDDARAVMADPRFSRNLARPGAARLSTTEDGGLFNRRRDGASDINEGQGHMRWRRLLSRWFTARKMETWRPRVQAMADDLLDSMLAKGSPGNLSAGLALPLPVRVICALVGAPSTDQDKFAHWSRTMLTLTANTQEEVDQAYREFNAYVSDLVDRNRADPGDDLLSELTQITDAEDGRLSQAELIATVRGLLLAGHETTSNMIAIMVAMLVSDRPRYEAVIDDPELVPGTVEEVLRMDCTLSAIGGVPRFITEDVELGEVTVPAGSTLIPIITAANRDPSKFPDPDRFDPRRENNAQHLTFGAGPHYCLGQPLARLELQVVLDTLTRRLPGLRLRDAPEDLRPRTGAMTGGLQDVWVTW
ncbi:MAG: cytochrome P450 [Nonomuraea sp.]|nr:cytochrome P450 [Nonomuraea sp.]NUP62362.1 cytochrome P450 [Nonomuraea sp.]NUP81739.1 cytochrome P450 [Nonomuraea sp.]NUS04962.1 cytochrome P450 [Nonomuraea sp.]NUT10435.1 cytochrome P450 [Nonomuraea sp.]